MVTCETRNWQAWIKDGKSLNLQVEVGLPQPGHIAHFEEGSQDKAKSGALVLELKIVTPDIKDEQTLEYSLIRFQKSIDSSGTYNSIEVYREGSNIATVRVETTNPGENYIQ